MEMRLLAGNFARFDFGVTSCEEEKGERDDQVAGKGSRRNRGRHAPVG